MAHDTQCGNPLPQRHVSVTSLTSDTMTAKKALPVAPNAGLKRLTPATVSAALSEMKLGLQYLQEEYNTLESELDSRRTRASASIRFLAEWKASGVDGETADRILRMVQILEPDYYAKEIAPKLG